MLKRRKENTPGHHNASGKCKRIRTHFCLIRIKVVVNTADTIMDDSVTDRFSDSGLTAASWVIVWHAAASVSGAATIPTLCWQIILTFPIRSDLLVSCQTTWAVWPTEFPQKHEGVRMATRTMSTKQRNDCTKARLVELSGNNIHASIVFLFHPSLTSNKKEKEKKKDVRRKQRAPYISRESGMGSALKLTDWGLRGKKIKK